MSRLIWLCCVVGFSMAFVNVVTVQACTGSSSNLLPVDAVLYDGQEYSRSSVVVGRINAVSNSRINAILQVDQVLKGNVSSQFILYARDSITNLQFLKEGRGYPYSCSYTGIPLSSGRRFIAVLWHGSEGSYGGTLVTEDPNGLFSIPDEDQPDQTLFVDYESVVTYALQRINGTGHLPENRAMPRPGYIRLLTESGSEYIVPADQTTLIQPIPSNIGQCDSRLLRPCLIIAPNGIDTVTLYPTGSGVEASNDYDYRYRALLEGETAVFSRSSDALIVWRGQELSLYATANQASLDTTMEGGLTLLRALKLDRRDPVISGAGAWSPNGRFFAFSSQAGIWFWDVLTPDAQPVLWIASNNEPIHVRFFSPMGNYLAVEAGLHRYHIDLATLEEYPDGVFSTDDRLLAVYDTNATAPTPLKIYMMLPEFKPVDRWVNSNVKISQFEWISLKEYVYSTCGDAILQAEMPPGFDKPWCKIRQDKVGWDSPTWIDGILFDYDFVTESLTTVIDQDTITVNGEVIELEEEIDSPIIGIELVPLIDLNYRNF